MAKTPDLTVIEGGEATDQNDTEDVVQDEAETAPQVTIEQYALDVAALVKRINKDYSIAPATGLDIIRFAVAHAEAEAFHAARQAAQNGDK